MQHLFLASSIGTPGVGESIRAKLGHKRKLKTAFITTPIEVEDMTDDEWYQADRSALSKNDFDLFDYTITNKNLQQIKDDLVDIDVLYISGGTENYLLEQSQKSGFIDFVKQFVDSGKPYIGTSAGSIIAGSVLPPYLRDDSRQAEKAIKYDCYNLVNFTTVPHWGSNEFRDKYLHERKEAMYTADSSFIFLTDMQYVEVRGDNYRIIDVRREQ